MLLGAAEQPQITLLTALPLMWGDGNAADIVQGRSERSATLAAISQSFEITPIDTLSAKTLGRNVAMIAQPRRLTAAELVAFDKWVRRGGRAMVFADPELRWESQYAPGDNRRAPPVELLDPLLTHWGLTLGDSDRKTQTRIIDGSPVIFAGSGVWTYSKQCTAPAPEMLDCRIGKGRVVLVGDADVLDARLWQSAQVDNPGWIVRQLLRLSADETRDCSRIETEHTRNLC